MNIFSCVSPRSTFTQVQFWYTLSIFRLFCRCVYWRNNLISFYFLIQVEVRSCIFAKFPHSSSFAALSPCQETYYTHSEVWCHCLVAVWMIFSYCLLLHSHMYSGGKRRGGVQSCAAFHGVSVAVRATQHRQKPPAARSLYKAASLLPQTGWIFFI